MKIILTIFATFILTWANGQNLVPNPSFEDTVHCPTTVGQLSYSQYWTNPTGCTPDYYNACSFGMNPSSNSTGSQSPHNGSAYAGIWTFAKAVSNNNREYVQVQLTSPPLSNHKYLVSFYVSLAEISQYALSSIGAYFSSTSISGPGCYVLNHTPQILNPSTNILTDKTNWMFISDTLYANGGEQYMTIGNFLPDSASDTLFLGNLGGANSAYYYLDDISVIDYGTYTGIPLHSNSFHATIFPNPTSDQSTLRFDNTKKEICTLTLYDLSGQTMRTINNITSNQVTIQKNDLTHGLYYFVLRTSDRVIVTGKLAVD